MRQLKILILEDNSHDADLEQRAIRKSGINFTAKVVDTRAEFTEALHTFEPDVILSDHALPQLNSLEALKIFKEAKKNIPFILVTGTVSEEFAVQSLKNGADDYLLKNNLTRLPVAIQSAIAKREEEKKKLKAIALLKKSEEKNRALLQAIPDLISVISKEGIYENFKADSESELYLKPEHFIGKSVREALPAEVADTVMFFIETTLKTRLMQVFEYSLNTGDRINFYEARMCPLRLDESILVIVRNINDRKKAEEEKTEHIRGLEKMLHMTSHNVRQPVAHILGIAGMLDDNIVSPDELKQINSYMQQSASSLDAFTRELTNYMLNLKSKA